MTLFLATVSSAWALMVCEPARPVDSLPRNGAVDVPLDVAPAFVFSGTLCGTEAGSAVLTTEDGTEVAAVVGDEIDTDSLVEVFPAEPLEPLTTYVLTLTTSGEVVVSFTTGEGTSTPVEGRPTVEIRAADGFPRGDNLQVTAQANPAGTEDSLVVFVDEATGLARGGTRSPLGESVEGEWLALDAAKNDEVCVTVLQRGVAGDRIESDVDCFLVTNGWGCATSTGAPGVLGLLVAGMALVRRRARA